MICRPPERFQPLLSAATISSGDPEKAARRYGRRVHEGVLIVLRNEAHADRERRRRLRDDRRSPRTAPRRRPRAAKIGRASCRERVCQYVSISVVAVSLKRKIIALVNRQLRTIILN